MLQRWPRLKKGDILFVGFGVLIQHHFTVPFQTKPGCWQGANCLILDTSETRYFKVETLVMLVVLMLPGYGLCLGKKCSVLINPKGDADGYRANVVYDGSAKIY